MRTLILALAASLPAISALAANDAERGRELAVRWCTECHIVAPDEAGGDAGPPFEVLSKARTEPGLRAWLFEPHPPMPDLNLTADEIEAILAYIDTLRD